MLVPSKFTRLEESTIFKLRYILDLETEYSTVQEVYEKTKNHFSDAAEFLHALDVLFVLGKINITNDKSGLIVYA